MYIIQPSLHPPSLHPFPPHHTTPPPPYSCSTRLQRFHIIIARYHHSHLRPPAGRPACAGDLSAVNQPYHPHPHPTLLLTAGRQIKLLHAANGPTNSHRQTAQLNYIYRYWCANLVLHVQIIFLVERQCYNVIMYTS